ncbi:MAG: hypothetical protein J7493_17130 [Porphyrobacter sp.]|nr:hypothetical protein [Porphyrobacter sp.]
MGVLTVKCNVRAARHRAIVIWPVLFGLPLGSCTDIFAEQEERCRSEARVIIHDPELWMEYLKESEMTYLSRAEDFPGTGKVVLEHAQSFEKRFGPELKDRPSAINGAVVREDVYIVQNDTRVAQFVNFYARRDFGGRTVQTCLGSFPELYSETLSFEPG